MQAKQISTDILDNAQLLTVLVAIKNGDFSVRMPLDRTGVAGKIADTVNEMIDHHERLTSEFRRVSTVVGKEGKTAERAALDGARGVWKDCIESFNLMVDLLQPTAEVARVIGAVAKGNLSQSMSLEIGGRPLTGEFFRTANTINTMVDQLNAFASEVTRVAREVGTEGKLGGQADVQGVAGIWKDLTDSVNFMASNLTGQVRNIAEVSTAIASGDLSKKITADARGEILELKNTINTMVDQLNAFASEVTRVAREVGTEGKLGGQADVQGVAGIWKDLTDSVNFMASNLTGQVRNIAEVTTAVATGDLSKKITVDVRGEILELKNTVNTMVDRLNAFASEVTRVAREVGTEGKLGGQANVQGVAGTWKDLTDSVNFMASNLTGQVRNIARVVTAVANGKLRLKLVLEAKGEIAELADTINAMIDTLATFADQVTTVAREVGIEGKLGGQASVPGAAGTWRDLTDNVNRLAANLTTQVRAIAEVATAVTAGDLSRSITVEAAGEVAALKDNINQMIRNLADTTRINTEQDWLKTNVARFTRLLQGQRDLLTVARLILSELAPLVSVQHGLFYFLDDTKIGKQTMTLQASYGFQRRKHLGNRFRAGEGLVGQCLLEKSGILLTEVPGDYIKISSGLGEAAPHNIVVLPVLFEGEVLAILELASFKEFSPIHLTFLDQLTESIGIVLNTLQASARTEQLLKQSQSLTEELQNRQRELQDTNQRLEQQAKSLQISDERLREQQDELRQTNAELEHKARLLADQNREVERKNREIGVARQELEDKAEQLAVSSKYKSEFLANMSHELRTPLTNMLVLSQLLADNAEGNLTSKQIQCATNIHSSGADLLTLISEILDLAKIESGLMEVQISAIRFTTLRNYVERNFRELATEKGLSFVIELDEGLPQEIYTDSQRLQQILRNLLSNAFKFTAQGEVRLRIEVAASGWSAGQEVLDRAKAVIAFSVRDTGIGIPPERQALVFAAFQQADGTTSRQYGGTGLGLSISREIATLLRGEVRLASRPGEGSIFTLYLPLNYVPFAEPWHRLAERAPVSTRLQETAQTVIGEISSAAAGTEAGFRALPREGGLAPAAGEIADDREQICPDDRVLLVVEDDPVFAGLLLQQARQHGFKAILTACGAPVLDLARRFQPAAITLDVRLPDVNGVRVLDRLKHDVETWHIPVHVISVTDEPPHIAQEAVSWMQKPLSREGLEKALATVWDSSAQKVRHLLLVEDDAAERERIVGIIGNGDVEVQAVASAEEALAAIEAGPWDGAVVGMSLPKAGGVKFIRAVRARPELTRLPIIAYARKALGRRQRAELHRLAGTRVVEGAKSLERLLYKTTLLLRRPQRSLTPAQQEILDWLRLSDPELAGRNVLIIDDDARNVFALTTLLERHQMNVLCAENGPTGIALLEQTPGIDIVLMDVMMPGMDGYESMRGLRREERFKSLPIIALTAKAMQGDREACLEAGASDYIAKPIDNDDLLSLMRIWLYRVLAARLHELR